MEHSVVEEPSVVSEESEFRKQGMVRARYGQKQGTTKELYQQSGYIGYIERQQDVVRW